jgi:hypothetical protein
VTSFPPSSPLFPTSALARHSVCLSSPLQRLCGLFHPPSLPSFLFLPPCRCGGGLRHLPQHGARNAASGRGGFCQQWGPQSRGSLDRFRRMVRTQTLFALLFPLFQLFFSSIFRTCRCFHGFHRAVRDVSRPFRTYSLPPPRSDASIRYHGERADFSVTNSSRAKLTIEVRPPLLPVVFPSRPALGHFLSS